jgi:hypothetical protein
MKKLKIGIIVNENFVDKYTYQLAKWIKFNNKKLVTTSFISIKKEKNLSFVNKKLLKKILFKFVIILENLLLQFYPNHKNHLKRFDLREIIKNKIIIQKYKLGNKHLFKKKDIQKIKKEKFDILIRSCSEIISDDLIKTTKHGILSLHHGDYRKFRGSPAGFWEVFYKEIKTGFMIQKINKNLDFGNIILNGFFQTKSFFLLNQAELYEKSNFYIKKIILDLYDNKKLKFIKKKDKGKVFETPKITNQIKYLIKIIFILINKIFIKNNSFKLAVFNINSLNKPTYIENEKKKFLADPFLFKKNGEIYCFAEEYDFIKKKGYIICKKYSDQSLINKKIIIKEKFHLSFPYIFEYNNNIYMCPETSEISEIRIYKCISFPYKWKFYKSIKKNIKAVDSMLFKKNNLWWLFTNIDRSLAGDFTHDISIFYSKDGPLTNKWHNHPLNPIKMDSSQSRNGGLIFDKNKIFRISQKQGFDNYGQDINFHQIKLLTTKKYIEKNIKNREYEKIKKILNNKNVHHFSKLDEKIIIDFK